MHRKISNKTVFRKLIKVLDGIIGRNLRIRSNQYKYSKNYSGRDHLLSMFFLQLSGSEGLRDVSSKYNKSPKIKNDFKIPSYSQLSRLNKNKPSNMFKEIYEDLLSKAQKELNSHVHIKNFNDIKIIDSSIINIGKGLANDLYYESDKAAVRISTLLSDGTKLPCKISIVPAKVGERKCIDGYVDKKDTIYLFDKGYFKFSWYDDMTDNEFKFITRQSSHIITEEYSSTYTGIDNLYDYDITMGTDYSKNKTKHKYREILYFEEDSDEEFRLVTNIFHLPAKDIVSLYKKRWDIELFFKWIKQHLTIKNWIGYTFNAITLQIYSALIIYILLLLIKNRLKSSLSLFDILRKLRANILERYAFKNILLR